MLPSAPVPVHGEKGGGRTRDLEDVEDGPCAGLPSFASDSSTRMTQDHTSERHQASCRCYIMLNFVHRGVGMLLSISRCRTWPWPAA
jgi:hypothetical protein